MEDFWFNILTDLNIWNGKGIGDLANLSEGYKRFDTVEYSVLTCFCSYCHKTYVIGDSKQKLIIIDYKFQFYLILITKLNYNYTGN